MLGAKGAEETGIGEVHGREEEAERVRKGMPNDEVDDKMYKECLTDVNIVPGDHW